MTNLLPIGSIVQLQNGTVSLMILSRYPLYNLKGEIGYFDYVACVYPVGTSDEQAYYFNHHNIDKVLFKGYINEDEEKLQSIFQEKQSEIKYPRLNVEDIE